MHSVTPPKTDAQSDTNIAQLITARTEQDHRQLASKLDRLLGPVLAIEWIGMIIMALVISPQTWLGNQPSTHIHVWAAVGLGGLICLPAAFLGRTRPGEQSTRLVIAMAQGLVTALIIHLGGGRIEWHFSVFASLAVIAAYRDIKVLLAATVVIAADHLARGVFWPQSIYGVESSSQLRWLEHAAWVVVEDAFLIYNIRISLREMRSIAEREVELEHIGQAAIAKATTQMAEQIKAIESSGDLTRRIDEDTHEITQPLAQAINGFIQALREIIDEVRQAADTTASASTQMDACLATMTQTTGELSQQAMHANDLVEESAQAANDGGHVIGQTIQSLTTIRQLVDTSGQRVATLSSNADTIMELVTVIQDIADQTNLLALNAAIESARAGEHGRGFAVVADEVRKLADRTAATTGQIEEAISQMKQQTDDAVRQIDQSREQTDQSTQQGEEANQKLAQIVGNTQSVADQVSSMSDHFTTVTASATEMNQAVGDLSQRVEMLNHLVSRFETR